MWWLGLRLSHPLYGSLLRARRVLITLLDLRPRRKALSVWAVPKAAIQLRLQTPRVAGWA